MDKMALLERSLLIGGFLFGAYCGNTIINEFQSSSPPLINEALMTLFGGIVGAGAFYILTGGIWIMIKLTIHCKNLVQVPSEEQQ